MKLPTLIILLILLAVGYWLFFVNPSTPSVPPEIYSNIANSFSEFNITDFNVGGNNETLLVRVTRPYFDKEEMLTTTALVTKNLYSDFGSKNITYYWYLGDEPAFSVNYKDRLDSPIILDIRNPDFAIKSDLLVFDVMPYEVDLSEDKAHITLSYEGDESSFWREFIGMGLATVQDAPWIDEVSITYLPQNNEGKKMTISLPAEDFISAFNNSLTPQKLADDISIEKSD